MTHYPKECLKDVKVYFEIEAAADNDWITVHWQGFQKIERSKAGMLKELEVLKATGRNKVLNYNTAIKGPYPVGIDKWIAEEWMPKAESLGLKYAATIVSSNIFASLSAEQTEMAFNGITYKNFEDEGAAIRWLSSV
ncbi:hypothetical protein [uncultured Microscilla sp.]|uniref:hypothetical protein n=1 Tax=uncultured Microscilla sp. TaxID=432653 RepID=UPI00260C447C|nr:hypothetical protein [uncultured Microscilla sp.]